MQVFQQLMVTYLHVNGMLVLKARNACKKYGFTELILEHSYTGEAFLYL